MVVKESPTAEVTLMPYDVFDSEERRRRGNAAKSLLIEWETDESDYEDATWPELKAALDEGRRVIGARLLFPGE